MTAIPYRSPAGCYPVGLLALQEQPGDCGDECPCSVGPSDGSAYGWPSGAAPWSWLGPVPTDQAVTR